MVCSEHDVGEVVGVVVGSLDDPSAQGLNYAASASAAAPVLDAWRVTPQPPALQPLCDVPLGPSDAADNMEGPTSLDPLVGAVMATFEIYFTAVNLGDYAAAWSMEHPRAAALARGVGGRDEHVLRPQRRRARDPADC